MFFTHELRIKVIHNKTKLDWAPLVSPTVGGGCCFVIVFCLKPHPQEVIGQPSGLIESITRTEYGKVYPLGLLKLDQVTVVYEFLWDISELDVHVLWVFQRSVKVKSLDVKARTSRSR